MSWYKVTFKQIQPIHLGYKKHGVINETRVFITGQMMWGALVNAYGRVKNWNSDEYEQNQTLFENISCFYPMIDNEVLYPKFEEGEFYLGNYSENEFRKNYTTTLLSTAINPNTRNAKDESLHELDVILPNNIYWVGYVQCDKMKLEELKEIYIGGDSRYGLGLIKLEEIIEESYAQNPIKGKIEEYSSLNTSITNFVKFNNQKFEGKLEILAEFDFNKNRPKVVESGLYISVGSKIKGNTDVR